MKVLRCLDISPMYCEHEIVCDTVEEVLELARTHAAAEHGISPDKIAEATVGFWRLHIHDYTAPGGALGR